jgi:hypothetical protein
VVVLVTPYKIGAPLYLQGGWAGIIPLPPGQKEPPPTGYTGWNGKDPSAKMIETWCNETVGDYQAASNIAIHMPDGVIGIDVDHYGDKTGGDTLTQLEAELGPLPPTYTSTSRPGTISGIKWYRIEPGLRWPTGPGKDIEFIHTGHRYAVVWPSVHPSGGRYIWVDQYRGEESPPPEADNLAELPWEWQARFTGGEVRTDQPEYRTATEDERNQCLTEGSMCYAVTKALNKFEDRLTVQARHDSALKTVMALCRLGEQGHKGVHAGISELKDRFVNLVAKDRADGTEGAEYQRMVDGGVVKVLAAPTPEEKQTMLRLLRRRLLRDMGARQQTTRRHPRPETRWPLGQPRPIPRRHLHTAATQHRRGTRRRHPVPLPRDVAHQHCAHHSRQNHIRTMASPIGVGKRRPRHLHPL